MKAVCSHHCTMVLWLLSLWWLLVLGLSAADKDAAVRREVALLEERSRTAGGWINYRDHPFHDSVVPNRNLVEADHIFQPMRITFEKLKESGNATTQSDYFDNVLLQAGAFWSKALSVIPVHGNLVISAVQLDSYMYCGDSEFTQVPPNHMNDGIPDTDLVLYVSANATSRFCSGSAPVVAVACNYDQFDRPTAGSLHFCRNETTVKDVIHEMAHVLGMSSNSFRFFWDSATGRPRTPRPFSVSSVMCVDGEIRNLTMPSNTTLQFFSHDNGQRYASIVTPKVRTVARNQFNCQSLPGAQLENDQSSSCTGQHWDARLFYTELLSSVQTPTSRVSHLTLAVLEDSGWYKANYTMGSTLVWGLGAGCEFAMGACLTMTGDIPDYSRGYFCNDGSQRACSPDLLHKQACTVIDHALETTLLPEEPFQYFPDNPTLGGLRQADYCPMYGSDYDGLNAQELDCSDSANAPSVNVFDEVYGEDSKCFESSVGEGLCFRTVCNENTLKFNVRGEWLVCERDFQQIEVRTGGGAISVTVTCPRLSAACPLLFSCPFNCAGRGVCNYNNTNNGVIQPKCECFDTSTNSSLGCSGPDLSIQTFSVVPSISPTFLTQSSMPTPVDKNILTKSDGAAAMNRSILTIVAAVIGFFLTI